ncbi:hypothetical protein Lac3_12370 [Claveliimonas bilis]|nr:hypothetical protein Lac3_12370 [Claveliimonas bilis]
MRFTVSLFEKNGVFRYNRGAKCGKDVDKLSKDGGKASGKLVENKLYIHFKM